MIKNVVSTYAIDTPCAVTDMKYCPGVPTFAPKGLRTHICQVPIRQANRKAPNATQKCARQSRSTLRTGNPPVRPRLELILRKDLHCGPHLTVAKPAVFVAGHEEIASVREFGMDLGDEARHHHGVDIRSGDQESVDHVRRGEAKRHPAFRRN